MQSRNSARKGQCQHEPSWATGGGGGIDQKPQVGIMVCLPLSAQIETGWGTDVRMSGKQVVQGNQKPATVFRR